MFNITEKDMKKLALVIMLVGSSALAGNSQIGSSNTLNCENGSFEEMGDGHLAIQISPDKIEVYEYEGFFEISRKETTERDATITVKPQSVPRSVEGVDEEVSVAGELTIGYQPASTRVLYSLLVDNQARTEILQCK